MKNKASRSSRVEAPRSSTCRHSVPIEKMALGGAGFGHLPDGRAVFIEGALLGDVVLVTRLRDSKRFATALEWSIEEPSEARVAPICRDVGRCGGCALMGLPIALQRKQKSTQVQESLERLGGLGVGAVDPPETLGGAELGYRHRLRLQVQDVRLGFFGRGSHDFCEVERCHLARPELWQGVEKLRRLLLQSGEVPDCDAVEVRCLGSRERPSAIFLWKKCPRGPGRFLEAIEALRRNAGDQLLVCSSEEPLPAEADEWLELSAEVRALVPVGAFSQVNPEVNRLVLERLIGIATSHGARTGLDLFCGFGNLTLPLARHGLTMLGVEQQGAAIVAARRSADAQALPARFIAGDAGRWLKACARGGQTFDLIVVDPPRAGAKGMAESLHRICRRALVMMSCDPATLARDVRELCAQGFTLQSAQVFDMFPQTHHTETLCILTPVAR